jgi:hypothetical protein
MSARLYDEDFYAWANQQAALLRAGKLSEADIENIAEDIDSMGKSEKRELVPAECSDPAFVEMAVSAFARGVQRAKFQSDSTARGHGAHDG